MFQRFVKTKVYQFNWNFLCYELNSKVTFSDIKLHAKTLDIKGKKSVLWDFLLIKTLELTIDLNKCVITEKFDEKKIDAVQIRIEERDVIIKFKLLQIHLENLKSEIIKEIDRKTKKHL